jgi:hypothetical protein
MIFAKYLPHLYQGADHKGHRTYNMGGGGGGGPTQSTVTQTSVPEWLRPQTEAVLGAGMQEYFDATPRKVTNPLTGETTTEYDITGTRPYTPYSQNAADYFAPFSQQQQQVFGEAAGMRTPGGFQTGQQMTGMAGQGGLDTVGSAFGYGGQGAGYGGQSAMFGQQAAGTGGMYERMATDPMSMQAYMSPYMQNVVEIQKQQAIEDAQRAQLGANLGAARQGTYGGARQTLAQTQREAALNKQLSDIQAQGLQSAFDQAQKSQQFGVTSGLQGLQAGISGAQTGIQGAGMGLQGVQGAQAGFGLLGRMGEQAANIGTAQQQADIARLGFQGQMGDIQQQRQQDIINQQIQNFALAQEMPAQRLAGYNALLRGYATPTSTISQYQAAANPLQTIGALGTAAGGFGTLMGGGKKAGGAIKLAGGGGITDKDALESFAERASIPQLQQSMQSGELKGKEYIGAPILQNKIVNEERMKAAQAAMAGGQQQGSGSILDGLLAKADQLQGITDIVEPIEAAGGGVVAFAGGDLVRHGNYMSRAELKNYLDLLRKRGVDPKTIEAIKNQKYGLARTALSKAPALGLAGIVGIPGMMATDALMSTDTGVGDEADVMFSGITPGSAGPRTAGSALEAGQQLLGALIPPGPGAETRAAQAEIDAQQEAQNAPPVSPTYPDESQRGIVPGPTAAKPKDEISAALDGITDIGQQGGMGQQQSLKDFADQYLKERGEYAGEDVLSKKLKERAEKEPSFSDRMSGFTQIGLAGSALRDPSQSDKYLQQAAVLRTAEAKARDEREMDYLKAMDRERQNRITAFDKSEQRMSDKDKQSAQFQHERQLNDARLAIQKLDVGAKIQANKLSAAAAKLASARKQYETSREYYTDTEFKIRNLAQKQTEEINSTIFDEEKKAEELQAVRLQLALEIDKLYTQKMGDMYPGMGLKNVTPKAGK